METIENGYHGNGS